MEIMKASEGEISKSAYNVRGRGLTLRHPVTRSKCIES